MYMCTYICGARNASVRALCLRVHLHVETCTDKFSLQLASTLVHRPNFCFSFAPQAKLECRVSPRAFHPRGHSPVWAPWCWLALESGMLKNYKTIYFFSLRRLRRAELPGNWENSFTPKQGIDLCNTSPILGSHPLHPRHCTPIEKWHFFESCVALFCYSNKEPALAKGCDLQYTNPLKKHKWNTQLGRSSLMRWSVVRSGSSQHPPCRPEVIPSEQLLIIIIIWHFSSTSGAIFFSQESRLIVYQLIYIKKDLIEGLIK